MGFQIIIGPLVKGEVFAEKDGSNTAPISYSIAAKFAEHFPGVWTALRNGDVEGSEPVTVKLDSALTSMIRSMTSIPGMECLDLIIEYLKDALAHACSTFEETELFVETKSANGFLKSFQ